MCALQCGVLPIAARPALLAGDLFAHGVLTEASQSVEQLLSLADLWPDPLGKVELASSSPVSVHVYRGRVVGISRV
jgi:hypothetical protein